VPAFATASAATWSTTAFARFTRCRRRRSGGWHWFLFL
jgi:hypothetical protein